MDRRCPKKLFALLEDLSSVGDRNLKYDLLIELASRFREVPPNIAIRPFENAHLVPACESEAYIWGEKLNNGSLKFHFAVENPQGISARVMAVIIDETLSGEPLKEVSKVDPEIVYTIFGAELSMGKSQGLISMLSMARRLAASELASDAS